MQIAFAFSKRPLAATFGDIEPFSIVFSPPQPNRPFPGDYRGRSTRRSAPTCACLPRFISSQDVRWRSGLERGSRHAPDAGHERPRRRSCLRHAHGSAPASSAGSASTAIYAGLDPGHARHLRTGLPVAIARPSPRPGVAGRGAATPARPRDADALLPRCNSVHRPPTPRRPPARRSGRDPARANARSLPRRRRGRLRKRMPRVRTRRDRGRARSPAAGRR